MNKPRIVCAANKYLIEYSLDEIEEKDLSKGLLQELVLRAHSEGRKRGLR